MCFCMARALSRLPNMSGPVSEGAIKRTQTGSCKDDSYCYNNRVRYRICERNLKERKLLKILMRAEGNCLELNATELLQRSRELTNWETFWASNFIKTGDYCSQIQPDPNNFLSCALEGNKTVRLVQVNGSDHLMLISDIKHRKGGEKSNAIGDNDAGSMQTIRKNDVATCLYALAKSSGIAAGSYVAVSAIDEIPSSINSIRWTSFLAVVSEIPSPMLASMTEEFIGLRLLTGLVVIFYLSWVFRYMYLTKHEFRADMMAGLSFYLSGVLMCYWIRGTEIVSPLLNFCRIISSVVVLLEAGIPWRYDWSILGRDGRAACLSGIECLAELSLILLLEQESSILERVSRLTYLIALFLFGLSYLAKKYAK